jgi:hypothetical protein
MQSCGRGVGTAPRLSAHERLSEQATRRSITFRSRATNTKGRQQEWQHDRHRVAASEQGVIWSSLQQLECSKVSMHYGAVANKPPRDLMYTKMNVKSCTKIQACTWMCKLGFWYQWHGHLWAHGIAKYCVCLLCSQHFHYESCGRNAEPTAIMLSRRRAACATHHAS